MARFISLRNKIFRLDIEKWSETRKRGRYLRYCIKPVRDHRNSLARSIDFYGPLAAVLLTTGAVAAGYGGFRPGTLAAALPLMALEILIFLRLRKWFQSNASLHYRLWTAGRQCQENIKKTGPEGLVKLVSEMLERIDGFSEVRLSGGRGKKRKHPGMGINARALLNGEPVAVACVAPDLEKGLTSPESVLKFREEIKNSGFNAGILAVAGFFTGEARRAALEERKNIRIALLDLYRLVELARETGHRVFPLPPGEKPEVRGKSAGAYRELFRKALSREKSRGYFLAAVIMLILWVTGTGAGTGAAYVLFGVLNLALSLYCLLSNREYDLLGPVRPRE